mmetsp:Transcript_30062/g.58842  ORF Transcript_30062/g.58842 Transcript_30062/m.58842 type:complete len:245 (+) Transcript_30062:523-1257(+)
MIALCFQFFPRWHRHGHDGRRPFLRPIAALREHSYTWAAAAGIPALAFQIVQRPWASSGAIGFPSGSASLSRPAEAAVSAKVPCTVGVLHTCCTHVGIRDSHNTCLHTDTRSGLAGDSSPLDHFPRLGSQQQTLLHDHDRHGIVVGNFVTSKIPLFVLEVPQRKGFLPHFLLPLHLSTRRGCILEAWVRTEVLGASYTGGRTERLEQSPLRHLLRCELSCVRSHLPRHQIPLFHFQQDCGIRAL